MPSASLTIHCITLQPPPFGEENRGDQKNRKGEYERGRWKEQKNAR